MFTCSICADLCFHDASTALRHLFDHLGDEPKEIQQSLVWWFECQLDWDSSRLCAPSGPTSDRDPRIDFYKDVLLNGGIRAEPGHSVGAKWIEFVTTRTGRKSIKEVRQSDWQRVLDDLDVCHRHVGDVGVVQFVEAVRGGLV